MKSNKKKWSQPSIIKLQVKLTADNKHKADSEATDKNGVS